MGYSIKELFDWKPHPVLRIPTDEQVANERWTPDQIVDFHKAYHEAIENEKADPYRYGFQLPHWDLVHESLCIASEVHIYGGNRSGKSEVCARLVVEAAMNNPESVIWCFQTTNENSIQMQQKYIYKYLPAELKQGKIKSKTAYI